MLLHISPQHLVTQTDGAWAMVSDRIMSSCKASKTADGMSAYLDHAACADCERKSISNAACCAASARGAEACQRLSTSLMNRAHPFMVNQQHAQHSTAQHRTEKVCEPVVCRRRTCMRRSAGRCCFTRARSIMPQIGNTRPPMSTSFSPATPPGSKPPLRHVP